MTRCILSAGGHDDSKMYEAYASSPVKVSTWRTPVAAVAKEFNRYLCRSIDYGTPCRGIPEGYSRLLITNSIIMNKHITISPLPRKWA